MRLRANRQLKYLPKRFPVGTVYVVEARGGEHGPFGVARRYVVLPNGRRIEVPIGLGASSSARSRVRRPKPPQNQGHVRRLSAAAKRIFRAGKKNRQSAGTH